ncbi:MAG: hypothetical protein ACLFTB_08560 [Desulfovibrionales bacterium]
MKFKVFLQARKVFSGSNVERTKDAEQMFSYDIEAPDGQDAVEQAKQKFHLEHGLEGWEIEGAGTITL